MLGSLLLLTGLATAGGWRSDNGHGCPTAQWSSGWPEATWTIPMARTNASPVWTDDMVCTTDEPTQLVCLSIADGTERWRASHPVVDALPPAEATRVRAQLADADAWNDELATAKKRYSALRRETRRGAGAEAYAEMEQLAARTKALEAKLKTISPYVTPADEPWIGWSSATPVIDDEAIYALFGNGVVARRTHDGEVVWRKWLGEPLQRMNGWTRGATSGLLRVGDLLIVPYGKLRAVSAATGEEVWTDNQPWKHFGTPAVVHADGEPLLATPGGRILRARDGTVVADQLVPNVYYTSPLVDGDRVVWLGHGLQYRDGSHVWAYDVAEDGTTTPVFDAAIDTDHRFFATPLSWKGSLWTVSELGEVWQLSGTDGSVQSRVSLEMKQVFSSPTQLGGRILILGDDGARLVDPSTGAITHGATATTRNSPAIDARCNAYLRSLDSLVRVSLPQ